MKKIFAFLISISIILFVLLYSIDFMAKDISYYNNFHRDYKIEKESGLSKEWIEGASNSLVEFIKSGDKEVLKNHLYKLFKLDRIVYTSLFIITLLVVIYKLFKNDFLFFRYIRKCILIAYISVISFLGICSVFFSESFVYFHKLFFDNDLWLLDYETDLMIRILPEEFFFVLFLNVIVLSTVFVFSIYIFLKLKDYEYN